MNQTIRVLICMAACTVRTYSAPPVNYVQVWEDTFDGTSLNTDNWTIGLQDPGTGDLVPGAQGRYLLNNKYDGYITGDDVWVADGNLVLQNRKHSPTYRGTDPRGDYSYTSGWIMSMHKVYFTKGYVEFRARFPSGDKVWPALWLIAEDLVWGPEWDMWEYFGYRSDVGYDAMGTHLMTGPWNNTKWDSHWIQPFDATYDCETWHVYGFEWTDEFAQWTIDGNVVHTLQRSASKDPSAWPDEDMYFVLNNATKTSSTDTTATWPNVVTIDYVALYTFQADTNAPADPTGLTATAGYNSVTLDWADNTDEDMANYAVYRSTTAAGPYTHLTDTPDTTSDYVDLTALNGTTYYYVVTAIDTSANESGYSNEDSATPTAASSTTLVGGAIKNGNFNSPGTAGAITFAQEGNWISLSGNNGNTFLNDTVANVYDGHYAQLSEQYAFYPALDTGYAMTEGDVFDISFLWHDGWQWAANDQILLTLYVTDDNTAAGTQTVLATVYSETGPLDSAYELVDQSAVYTAGPAHAGKTLFVGLQAQDGSGNTNGYAQIDNLELVVTAGAPPANNPPTFEVDPINEAAATEGVAYNGTINNATDDDGDGLTYSKLPGGPDWLNVATNGILSGTPATGDVGTNSWTVQVIDGKGGSDSAALNITVLPVPSLDIAMSGSDMTVSWPGDYTGWSLLYSTNLLETNGWIVMPGADVTNVFNSGSMTNDAVFFRLSSP
jgi:beta-glucanase (GH16 family)